MTGVAGTAGYEARFEQFVAATEALDFDLVNRPFLPFINRSPMRVLDVGAGIGQNAIELARRGHRVVAVEPISRFVDHAKRQPGAQDVDWVIDSLPRLVDTVETSGTFGFVLLQGVWHHLNSEERNDSISTLALLLEHDGALAISLRHGPPGAGIHSFPTSSAEVSTLAKEHGLNIALQIGPLPSVIPHKRDVTWTHVVLRKPRR